MISFVKDNIQNDQAAPAAAPAPAPAAAAPAAAAPAPSAPQLAPGQHISDSDAAALLKLGIEQKGLNGESSDKGVWFGNDGPYTNVFTNSSPEDKILVIWGPWASWVNKKQPLITASLPQGSSKTISFAKDQTGGWAAVGKDTKLVNGQISETWGEYTVNNYGVVDVSRLPNMNGSKMSISTPTCTSDFDRCVFVCKSGNVCTTDYDLLNCGPNSQPWANYGTQDGAPTGGCGGLGDSAVIKTSFY